MHKAIGEGFIDHQSGIADVRTRGRRCDPATDGKRDEPIRRIRK
jgi:hypothetical protein